MCRTSFTIFSTDDYDFYGAAIEDHHCWRYEKKTFITSGYEQHDTLQEAAQKMYDDFASENLHRDHKSYLELVLIKDEQYWQPIYYKVAIEYEPQFYVYTEDEWKNQCRP